MNRGERWYVRHRPDGFEDVVDRATNKTVAEQVRYPVAEGIIAHLIAEDYLQSERLVARAEVKRPAVEVVGYEQRRAIMEAEQSAACEEYFGARPQLESIHNRRIFESGFQHGYDDRPADVPAPGDAKDRWQPIETAPLDGTPVILFGNARWPVGVTPDMGDIENVVGPGRYAGGNWQVAGRIGEPTHWMPYPEPPAIAAQKESGHE